MGNHGSIKRRFHRGIIFGATATAALALAGCINNDHDDDNDGELPDVTYEATIERTEGGIPHITATDFGSLGFGTGYAAAEDNFCILARNILQYRSQLAEYFGAGEPNSTGIPENLASDYFYKMMEARGYYDHEVDPELEAQFAGFAAGYNRYLMDTGVDNIPDPECRGAEWVMQMTVEDVTQFHLKPVFLPNLAVLILPAQPPASAVTETGEEAKDTGELLARTSPVRATTRGDATGLPYSEPKSPWNKQQQLEIAALIEHLTNPYDKGSNGVAIGSSLSTNGKSVLFTNPHLDWGVAFRMYPRHHIIPGVLNELGANTFERANVGFGTNGHIAWTNTVSTSTGLMFYKIDPVPGNPMRYFFDGQERDIEALPVTVKVRNEDGTVSDASHTFYFSHFGPMLGGQFPWSASLAFTMRIAEEGPRGMQGGAIGIARATTVRELKQSLNRSQHTSSTNTIAIDSTGEVLYGDLGPVANFTDQQLVDCVFVSTTYIGNTSDCEWNTDPDSAAPGLLGASKQAFLFRNDYVTNSNDNYWLSNPNEPLTNVPLVQGDRVENERTLRTRSGLRMVQQRIDNSDGLGGNTFDIDSLQERMLSNQNYAGQILRADLVTLCNANTSITVAADTPNEGDPERAVDVSEACTALGAWDLHSNLESTGSHVMREFLQAAHAADSDNSDRSRTRRLPELLNYAVPFNVSDPVNTPSGLNTSDNPIALQSLAIAVETLNRAGVALDARLGDIQTVTQGGATFPWPGGEEFEGVFNKNSLALDETARGYPTVTGSSASWVMVTEFTEDGPVSRGNLVYSLSPSSESAHNNDMTEKFSNGELVDLPYHPDDVTAAAISTLEISEGATSCLDDGWQAFTGEAFADEDACIDHYRQLNGGRVTEYVTQ